MIDSFLPSLKSYNENLYRQLVIDIILLTDPGEKIFFFYGEKWAHIPVSDPYYLLTSSQCTTTTIIT